MDTSTNDRLMVEWIEAQPVESQKLLAEQKLAEYLEQAAQPRHASGNACIKLCYFIEQCMKSQSSIIQNVALSPYSCLSLFNFYIEWNEKNQNRSMRQVLDLISTLLNQKSNSETSKLVKAAILERSLSIIMHHGAQPLVKPAFKSLESFLAKGTIALDDLVFSHPRVGRQAGSQTSTGSSTNDAGLGDLVQVAFEWMALPDIAPAAGKFMVTIFRELRVQQAEGGVNKNQTASWQLWIQRGLEMDPESLENVKNYLFPPLFKIDRAGSLLLLKELNSVELHSDSPKQEVDSLSLLRLVALEAGKKAGLVEDPDFITFKKPPKRKASSIVLKEDTVNSLLVHPLATVRALAFSVLVNSSSSIRPFTSVSLQKLRATFGILFSETDAKFRNDILSNTKRMIERLRGAIAFLTREISNGPRQASNADDVSTSVNLVQNQSSALEKSRTQHMLFLEWFLDFLTGELVPTASYQRHITALKAFCLLLRSGIQGCGKFKHLDNETIWPFTIGIFNSKTIRLLLDLLLDPFEDVRATAAEMLRLASPTDLSIEASSASATQDHLDIIWNNVETQAGASQAIPQEATGQSPNILHEFLESASKLSLQTGRADYADGVAHCYDLIYRLSRSDSQKMTLISDLLSELETNVQLAEGNLTEAVQKAPVHGLFSALNLMILADDQEEYVAVDHFPAETQLEIVTLCSRLWFAVRDILCNDSPEGHLPHELEELETIDTKDILSYSFRAVHESSNLMRTLASRIKNKRRDGALAVPVNVFADIGSLSFEQLSTLRHRGAFSTVSLTFARVCQSSRYLPIESVPNETSIMTNFYKGALDCIAEQASTTRRSAGIPALIAGVLSSNTTKPSFLEVMTELKHLATMPSRSSELDHTNLPQVHAINCLREIFKSAVLGKRAESHVAEGLQIASDSLRSDIWAIRNCGLLLLRSLIDCLFGTSESKEAMEAGWDGRSIKLSYDKYPALPDLLCTLLNAKFSPSDDMWSPQIGSVESVFPALDIIRRAGPPVADRDQIYQGVCRHLGNKAWHIRELAGRTISTLLLHDSWLEALADLFDTCTASINRVHGTLMAARFTIERRRALDIESIIASLPKLVQHISDFVLKVSAYDVVHISSACVDLQNELTSIVLSSSSGETGSRESLFHSDAAFEDVESAINASQPSALLQVALLRQAIFLTGLQKDSVRLWRLLKTTVQSSSDLALAAVSYIAEAWPASKVTLSPISIAFIQMIEFSSSSQVRAAAVTELSKLLDSYFDISLDEHRGLLYELEAIVHCLAKGKSSPQLVNTEVAISGWTHLRDFLSGTDHEGEALSRLSSKMMAWGSLLSLAGDSRNDFDSRLSAVMALRSFFALAKLEQTPCQEFMLPALLALYDFLNDDDDEIRDIGAETVSAILKQPCTCLAAQKEFLDWLVLRYSHSSLFISKIIIRLTGSTEQESLGSGLISAEDQLRFSLQEDHSLFIEEEQNLFIDEVRETQNWQRALFKISPKSMSTSNNLLRDTKPSIAIARWALCGLQNLNQISKRDGPLGWASKPAVYEVCVRIILCANAVLGFVEMGDECLVDYILEIRDQLGHIKSIVALHPMLLALAARDSLEKASG